MLPVFSELILEFYDDLSIKRHRMGIFSNFSKKVWIIRLIVWGIEKILSFSPKGHIMAVPCVPDVPQVFKFFEKIFGKWDMGHMKNHIMAVPHVPKSSKFLKFFVFYMKKFNLLSETLKKKMSGSLCMGFEQGQHGF